MAVEATTQPYTIATCRVSCADSALICLILVSIAKKNGQRQKKITHAAGREADRFLNEQESERASYGSRMTENKWLPYYKPLADPKLRLFAFHWAGGSASSYNGVAWQALPDGVELLAVQLPGREKRDGETTPKTAQAAAKQAVGELKRFFAAGSVPTAIFAHSMVGPHPHSRTQYTHPRPPLCTSRTPSPGIADTPAGPVAGHVGCVRVRA